MYHPQHPYFNLKNRKAPHYVHFFQLYKQVKQQRTKLRFWNQPSESGGTYYQFFYMAHRITNQCIKIYCVLYLRSYFSKFLHLMIFNNESEAEFVWPLQEQIVIRIVISLEW